MRFIEVDWIHLAAMLFLQGGPGVDAYDIDWTPPSLLTASK
jgi:hypothetical protein